MRRIGAPFIPTFFCMIIFVIDLLRSLLLITSAIVNAFLSALQQTFRYITTSDSSIAMQTAYLQEQRAVLLIRQDSIARQLAVLDEQIHQLTVHQDDIPVSPRTPPRSKLPKQSSIGQPYPLLYIPARTPEEQRRNDIISWVNDLRVRNLTSSDKYCN